MLILDKKISRYKTAYFNIELELLFIYPFNVCSDSF